MSNKRRKAPAIGLAKAVTATRELRRAVGDGPYSREFLAEGLGYTTARSGAAARKIGALAHFNLIARAGGGYALTELAKRILSPTSDEEEREAIVAAAKSPTLYSELFERFGGTSLPARLENVLHREFGVSLSGSGSVAALFRESATFAQLLRDGILHPELSEGASVDRPVDDEEGAEHEDRSADRSGGSDMGLRNFAVPLSGSRVGVLRLPAQISPGDVDRITKWLDLMKDVLTDVPQGG